MARLIYAAITSLDGYVEDADGGFEWAAPDAEVHAFVNDQEREVGTYLYGRRMYDTMRFWQDPPDLADEPPVFQDYAQIWQAADKVVYSRTLAEPTTPRTRVERDFDPAVVRALKDEASRPLSVGGATLGGEALRAGLVDEVHQFVTPVVVGGGLSWLPDGLRVDLELSPSGASATGSCTWRTGSADPRLVELSRPLEAGATTTVGRPPERLDAAGDVVVGGARVAHRDPEHRPVAPARAARPRGAVLEHPRNHLLGALVGAEGLAHTWVKTTSLSDLGAGDRRRAHRRTSARGAQSRSTRSATPLRPRRAQRRPRPARRAPAGTSPAPRRTGRPRPAIR